MLTPNFDPVPQNNAWEHIQHNKCMGIENKKPEYSLFILKLIKTKYHQLRAGCWVKQLFLSNNAMKKQSMKENREM